MDKPKAIIYPFDSESVHFFRYKDLNINFNIIGAVAPNGWGLTGKDVGTADGGENIGTLIENSFDKYYDSFDTLLLVDSYFKLDFEKVIYKNIESLVERKINIACFRALEPAQIQKISQLCCENNVSFMYYEKKQEDITVFDESIHKIKTPIIFVVGLSERTHKFDIQLALRENTIGMGYKVSQVGTKNYCETFGFHSFPDFMLSNTISESEKVIMFNRFIKSIEEKEQPDLIIVGIPGGVMAFNDTFTNKFGILAYMISQAVKPDAVIFSALFEFYTDVYFEEINNMFKYKFGYTVDCFNLSNMKFDSMESKGEYNKCYIVVDSNYIDNRKILYKNIEKPIFNVLNIEDRSKMSQYLIDVLAGEGNIEDVI